MKPQKLGSVKHNNPDTGLRANFEEATLWTKFAYCQVLRSCVYIRVHVHVRVVSVFSLDSIVYCDETQVFAVFVVQSCYDGSF